jgi:hypothetical protein
MSRWLTAALALLVLAAAGCGGGGADTTAVEGSGVPPATAPAATSTTPAATSTTSTTPATPQKIDAKTQFTKLLQCVGGKSTATYKWFQPTVDYAAKMGGDGFTTTLHGKPITLIVFPYVEAAQLGFKDIQDRLIRLQQVRPTDYATVAATAAQPIGNVLEVATAGALDAAPAAKVQSCLTSTAPPAA